MPAGVSTAPPPRSPPVAVATAGAARQRLVSSTRSHARRYDILSDLAAAEIDPVRAIASSSATLPGPIASAARAFAARTWKRTSGFIAAGSRCRDVARAVAVELDRLHQCMDLEPLADAQLCERAARD